MENEPKIDHKVSKSWTRYKDISFEFDAYGFAIKVASCPTISVRYYLPLRHDVIAKINYNALIHNKNPSYRKRDFEIHKYIHKQDNLEYWWYFSINTATEIPHNKPDLLLWDRDEKVCRVIEFICPAISVSRKVEEKMAARGPLISHLQIMHKDYRFKILPVLVGILGTISNANKESLKEMKFYKIEINKLLRKLRNKSLRDTVKICKTFMKFLESLCTVLIVTEYYPVDSFLLSLVR